MTATAQALAEGRVGYAHAAVIVDTVQGLPPGLEPALAARAETDLSVMRPASTRSSLPASARAS